MPSWRKHNACKRKSKTGALAMPKLDPEPSVQGVRVLGFGILGLGFSSEFKIVYWDAIENKSSMFAVGSCIITLGSCF